MSADFGPCAAWPAKYPCDISTTSPDALVTATLFATQTLDALSGRQFGVCPVTIRPCLRECMSTSFTAGWDPWPGGSIGIAPWFAFVSCGNEGCGNTCSCTRLSEVSLPSPIDSIVTVRVDGSPLVTGAYRLDDNHLLVRVDGFTWPRCNDLTKADTQVGTWSITANVGQQVPDGGRWAVGELACQFLLAMSGEECRLPRTVTRLVRQGVTIEFPDIAGLFEKGMTGLYLVDMFIKSTNPAGLTSRSRTYSVDRMLPRRAGT